MGRNYTMRFLLKEEDKLSVLSWLISNLGSPALRNGWIWSPVYPQTKFGNGIIVHIGAREDCTAFVLNNSDYIVSRAE